MKVTHIALTPKDTVPVLNIRGGYDRLSVLVPGDGRTFTLLPSLAILVEVEGFESQVIPPNQIWYVRVAKAEAKASK